MDTIRPPASETNDITDVTEEMYNLMDDMEQGNWQLALWRAGKIEAYIYQKMFLHYGEPAQKNDDRSTTDDYRSRVKKSMRTVVRRSQGGNDGDNIPNTERAIGLSATVKPGKGD